MKNERRKVDASGYRRSAVGDGIVWRFGGRHLLDEGINGPACFARPPRYRGVCSCGALGNGPADLVAWTPISRGDADVHHNIRLFGRATIKRAQLDRRPAGALEGIVRKNLMT